MRSEEKNVLSEWNEQDEVLWNMLIQNEGTSFKTVKNLEFMYTIKGNEMFISRKDKSITRSTIRVAYQKALELQNRDGCVKGPKMLGTFGASYLYPVFMKLGIITSV